LLNFLKKEFSLSALSAEQGLFRLLSIGDQVGNHLAQADRRPRRPVAVFGGELVGQLGGQAAVDAQGFGQCFFGDL